MDVSDEEIDAMYRAGYIVAFRLLGDSGDAEDCAQEATARAVARWERVAGHARPWVIRVAANLAIGRLRRRRRVTVGLPQLPVQPLVAGDGTTEVAARLDLRSALLTLPHRQRQTLVLRYVGDLSEAETAAALGCSTGTVKTHTRRGLDRLRRHLGPAGAPDRGEER